MSNTKKKKECGEVVGGKAKRNFFKKRQKNPKRKRKRGECVLVYVRVCVGGDSHSGAEKGDLLSVV